MQSTAGPMPSPPTAPLEQQVTAAVRDQAVPISRLLRLIWALDAEPSPGNENLRAQLRARIGAPLSA